VSLWESVNKLQDGLLRIRRLHRVQVLSVKVPEAMAEPQQLMGKALHSLIRDESRPNSGDLNGHPIHERLVPPFGRQVVLEELGDPVEIILNNPLQRVDSKTESAPIDGIMRAILDACPGALILLPYPAKLPEIAIELGNEN
jgi:hypothetical protein